MHTKFGLNQADFEKMVADGQFSELAQKLKDALDKKKISKGDFEVAMNWLRKSAQMKGKSI